MTLPGESLPAKKHPSAKDWLVSFLTLLAGAAIIAHLTRYNHATSLILQGEEFLLVNITFLLFVPCLIVFTLFRESPDAYGFEKPENDAGKLALIAYMAMLPVLLIATRVPALSHQFLNYYPMRPMAAFDWSFFLYWELTYGCYMFCWEFFYRGFLTFGFKRAFGPVAAVTLQTVGFGLMHWTKPFPEFLGSFVAGAVLGWLAIRGRSFYPCFAVHWAVTVTMDVLAIHSRQGGIF